MATAKYIEVISCCDPLIILNFKLPSGFNEAPDFYQYSGVSENGLVNDACYTISTKTGTIGFVIGLPDVDAVDFTTRTGCDDDKCICDTPCYTLYACDGSTFNTTTDLSANVGTYIRIEDDPKTWYVTEDPTKTTCDDAIDVVLDTVSLKTPCVLKCYQVTGNPATVTYMNADYDIITVIGATRVCSYITPIVTGAGSGFVVELGLCVDEECPEICFEFTNCQTGEVLVVSNSPTVIPYYAQEQVVTLQGYDGCWSIDITEVCECPVSVTILTAYASCPACLPIVNYKFTNCNNQSIIRYSIEDYSAYVGKTVELECGECWFVSEIDYVPPSTQSIVILYTFDNCTACNRTYYKLTDCTNLSNVTYTYTDLSSVIPPPVIGCDCISVTYTLVGGEPVTVNVEKESEPYMGKPIYNVNVGEYGIKALFWQSGYWQLDGSSLVQLESDSNCPFGVYNTSGGDPDVFEAFSVAPCSSLPVIKIKGCDTCFTVEETRLPINAGIVTLIESFDDCEACGAIAPCICTTVKNYDTLPHTYTYIDCNGIAQTITLTSNQESEKECIRNFVGDKLCNCITLTISGQLVTAVLQPNLVNGKPAWTFVYNTLTFNIVYDTIIGWKITNSTAPNPIATLGSPSITCPVGEWDVDSNPAIDISVFLDNGTLVLQGVLVYDYTANLYTGDIEVGSTVYEFRLRVFYFMSCNGIWYLEYFNTDLPVPVWTNVAAFPANCTCLNGVYTDVEPTPFYIEIKGFCEAQTVDCSVGYEPFIPSATDSIQEYGDCINGACPVEILPKRKVKPGYSTPTCDIEKYEKITCRSSEILYKQVIRLRYGISNCCPEDDEKWLIKKELIDLDALRDPDYICKPTTSCCNQPITSCGCDCNSTLKTCNS